MDKDSLYEALRARARVQARTIHDYLDPQRVIIDLHRAEDLLATLRVLDQVDIERQAEKSSRKE